MDFLWTKEQEQIKENASKFASQKLNDGIADRDKKSEFSGRCWKLCADFGIQGMSIPKEYGGAGYALFDIVAALEGLGYGARDAGLVFSINAHIWGCQLPLSIFGGEGIKKKYLPGLCDGTLIGAHAMTETDSGSDVFSLTTRAVRENDRYILNGNKIFVTNAPIADVFVVYARTGTAKGFSGISCFLVEKGTKGLRTGNNLEKMGLRTSPMSEVILDGCSIPSGNMIGAEGGGSFVFNASMEWERIFILASAIGIMERHIDHCVKYANDRKLNDKPLSQCQAVAHSIAGMKARLETSRLVLYKSVWLKAQDKPALLESAITKLSVSEAYIRNCRDAVTLFGAYGYMTEYQLERDLRDALASGIYSGTSDIQKNLIAGSMGL